MLVFCILRPSAFGMAEIHRVTFPSQIFALFFVSTSPLSGFSHGALGVVLLWGFHLLEVQVLHRPQIRIPMSKDIMQSCDRAIQQVMVLAMKASSGSSSPPEFPVG